jgi:mannosyl-oligosaccharide glucosidase
MLRSLFTVLLAAAVVTAEDPSNIPFQEVARETNQSLLWNPYRPNVYFGVRPRIPKSLTSGLMWAKVDNFQDVQHSE